MPSFRAALSLQVAVDDLAVAAGEHRNFESELPDRANHSIHGAVVLARISRILYEAVDEPLLDVLREGCEVIKKRAVRSRLPYKMRLTRKSLQTQIVICC